MYQGRLKIFFSFLFFAYYILHTTYYAYATTLSNDTYIIETKGVNLQPKASSTMQQPFPSPTPTPEPLAKPFSFSLSTTLIDFGEITPTDPTTRTTTILINQGDVYGFSLFAIIDHELQSETKKIIPDTTCDNGSCNAQSSSSWDNILTYGFGWRCDSTISFDCKDRFLESTYFKQFPNQAKNHVLSPIILGMTGSKKAETSITYKTNISTTQDIGLYKNTLSLIAVPNF